MSTEYVEEELVGDLVLAAECVIMYILINAGSLAQAYNVCRHPSILRVAGCQHLYQRKKQAFRVARLLDLVSWWLSLAFWSSHGRVRAPLCNGCCRLLCT